MAGKAGNLRGVSSRQRVTVAARLVATVVIAVVLARRVHLADRACPTATRTTPRSCVARCLHAARHRALRVPLAASARHARRVTASLYRLTRHYLASLFVGNFLPSTVGGDVLRVTRLGGETGDTAGPFASVVLERMSGWIVLPG